MRILKKLLNAVCHPAAYFNCYVSRVQTLSRQFFMKRRQQRMRKKFLGNTTSIFSPDCTGGVLSNVAGLQFRSPTVNLFFPDTIEYFTYLAHLEDYSCLLLEEDLNSQESCPCGILHHPDYGTVHLCFRHYSSFAESRDKWMERTKRINCDNKIALFIAKEAELELLSKFSQIEGFRKFVITFPSVYKKISSVCCDLRLPVYSLSQNFDGSKGEWLHPSSWLGIRPVEQIDIPTLLTSPVTYPLVMTATVDPKGMSGLSVNDMRERAGQYLGTLRFYLENPAIRRIVFAENSGYDLTEFRKLASQYPDRKVEWLSCSLNDYPRHLGKSYGELRILDYVTEHSTFVKEAGCFVKVTGRFPILNIGDLLREAETRQPWALFCDCKDHKLYDWLHLGWNGHACDTRFFIVSTEFYRKYFYGHCADLDDSQDKLIETMFFQIAKDHRNDEKIVRRFHAEPEYSGKAGHVQISIIGVNNYSGVVAKTKRAIRRFCRRIVPWFWF